MVMFFRHVRMPRLYNRVNVAPEELYISSGYKLSEAPHLTPLQ